MTQAAVRPATAPIPDVKSFLDAVADYVRSGGGGGDEAGFRGLGMIPGYKSGPGGVSYGYRNDPAGNPTTTGYIHGPGGLFSFPGVDQEVFTTVVGARGILSQLPSRASVDTNPLFAVLTGIGAETGAEKTEVCDDAPVAGIMSACRLWAPFGRYERQTAQIELNRLGQHTDRADPMDLRIVGTPLAGMGGGLFGTGPGMLSSAGVLQNEMQARMYELATVLHRLLSQQLWVGNPSNNNGDAYREVSSFSVLVNTGHRDAITGVTCPGVDSDVKEFNYHCVSTAASELVQALTYMARFLRELAIRTGVTPVRWVFVMRPEMFYEISAVWPCAYLTYRCTFDSDAARLLVDGAEQVRMRDEMRAGSYLLIDGIRYEVIGDDGIPFQTPADNALIGEGNVASDIYLIPMSILGARAVTYLEYMDYGNESIDSALALLPQGAFVREGPWLTTWKYRNWCFQGQTKTEPRLILRTPWLAGRLNHVCVTSFQMPRQPFPSDPYFVAGGGVTSNPGPSYYSLWQS
jgi:hypothetical protein